MPSEIVVNAEPFETRIALLENGVAAELYIERESGKSIVGNIYKGKVTKVLPGMQAAFVDIGLEKAGFLYVSDVDTIESIENYRKFASEQSEDDDDLDFEGNDFGNGDDYGNGAEHERGKGEQQNGSHRNLIGRRPRRWEEERHIEDLLKDGQDVIVQVSKEPLGTKGSRLTSYITLPGRYVVYMPTIKQIGISRRIENEEERKRLKKLVRKNRQPGAGYIVRTASETMPAQDIEANVNFLHALWEDILVKNESASSPSRIHSNLNIIERTVRDLFNSSVDRMIIDDKEQYLKTREFLQSYYPHLV
ncbi:MAG: ribonuclease E/G, partial [Nitrospinae bacterium]|nr:ribonuclease E/G [Nitrospinota bacterium]